MTENNGALDSPFSIAARRFAERTVRGDASLVGKRESQREVARITLAFAFSILAQYNLEPKPRWNRYIRKAVKHA